jgi:hypothetical protein
MASVSTVVAECSLPGQSVLQTSFAPGAYFQDAYRASLGDSRTSVVKSFVAIFGHRPTWMKLVMVFRNWVANLFGIEAPTASEVMNPIFSERYFVGQKIGAWPIFSISETELVAGRNNKHLDFRLSILRVVEGEASSVVVSTVCQVHNAFGKVYLFFVVPVHKRGVQWLIKSAIASGRL